MAKAYMSLRKLHTSMLEFFSVNYNVFVYSKIQRMDNYSCRPDESMYLC